MDNEEFLLKNFSDLSSPLFGEININRIYQQAKTKSLTEPTSIAAIKKLQSKVESLSTRPTPISRVQDLQGKNDLE